MLLPFSLLSSWSPPRRNLPVRSPGDEQRRWRQVGPVERRLRAQQIEEGAAGRGLRLVDRRKFRRVDQLHAGRDFEAAGAADDQIARHAGFPDSGDQLVRIAGGEMHRADHRVMALEAAARPATSSTSAFVGVTPGSAGDLVGMAGDRGDLMAAARQFGEDARAVIAGGADQGDFMCSSFQRSPNGYHWIPAMRKRLL